MPRYMSLIIAEALMTNEKAANRQFRINRRAKTMMASIAISLFAFPSPGLSQDNADISPEEMHRIVGAVVRNPARPGYEICHERFTAVPKRDTCVASLFDPRAWTQHKLVSAMKAMNDVACNLEKSLSADFLAALPMDSEKLKKACNEKVAPRVLAIANGASPTSCLEYKWANLTGAQLGEGTLSNWAVYAQPKGSLRDIAGELVNVEDQRYLIRQTQQQAEMDVIKTLDAASIYFRQIPEIVRKYAIVLVTSKTAVMGRSAEFGQPFAALGVYRRNETLTTVIGEAVPTQVIEALCVEAARF